MNKATSNGAVHYGVYEDIIFHLVELADGHRRKATWKSKSDAQWLCGIMEEVGEACEALDGQHEHPIETELYQIASASINMLLRLKRRNARKARGT